MFNTTKTKPFVWKENSKVMHDKVIGAAPFVFRLFSRSAIDGGLAEHGCGDVTEAIMYQVVREKTPPAHLEASLKILDKYRTTSIVSSQEELN